MIFSRWRRPALRVAWEYAAAGVLWRLLPSREGTFVLEDRDLDTKRVTFAGIDMRSGEVLWRNVALDEPWWVSVELVTGGHAILHGYGTPDMPDHRKIYMLDARSGALRWQNTELALQFLAGDRLYAASEEFARRRYFELDPATGTVLRELEETEMDEIRFAVTAVPDDLVTFPQVCADTATLGEGLSRLVASMAAGSAPAMTEVLRSGDVEAVAVHVNAGRDPARPAYTQRLAVRRGDRTLFEDVLASGAATLAPDGFFAAAGMLYYVKDQRILRALALHGS